MKIVSSIFRPHRCLNASPSSPSCHHLACGLDAFGAAPSPQCPSCERPLARSRRPRHHRPREKPVVKVKSALSRPSIHQQSHPPLTPRTSPGTRAWLIKPDSATSRHVTYLFAARLMQAFFSVGRLIVFSRRR